MTFLYDRRTTASAALSSPFLQRHLGPSEEDQQKMLSQLGYRDLDAFIADVVPDDILDPTAPLAELPEGCDEATALRDLQGIAADNRIARSLIGLGYHGTATPALIQRHVFENPAF